MKDKALFWFRRDLRLKDNHGLSLACREFREVIPFFVFDTEILSELEDRNDRRVSLIHEMLVDLDGQLRKHGSRLLCVTGKPAKTIVEWAKKLEVQAVLTNNDYEPYAVQRDDRAKEALTQEGIRFLSVKDQVVFEKDEILNTQNSAYQKYSAYRDQWLKTVEKSPLPRHKLEASRLIRANTLKPCPEIPSLKTLGFESASPTLPATSRAANKRWKHFQTKIADYEKWRDFPARAATSELSIDFRFGLLSIRPVVRWCLAQSDKGTWKWLNELIWRDFYQMILSQHPWVKNSSFRQEFRHMPWSHNQEHFQRWCEGQTGFPLVDAAMRCLVKTGRMHNRLRMVCASFLTKDLRIDWRWGERFFARYLLDFDLAANNGNWQWCASTGTDSQPYFRIFSPWQQSLKYDPQGEFIAKFCPELAHLPSKQLHQPEMMINAKNYPSPMVNHQQTAHETKQFFAKAKAKRSGNKNT